MNTQKRDMTALFKLGYGLYVVTTNDGEKDNGLIVNTVMQLTSSPERVALTVNKANYSYEVIKKSGKANVNCLSEQAPFSVFEKFGFSSGRDKNKFENEALTRSENGLVLLDKYINAYLSLEVTDFVDLDTHGMFIATVSEAAVISDSKSMTYAYYHENVKPKPNAPKKRGYVCKICGYIHDEEELPDDFICPLCKHGASDFEKIS